MNLKVKETFNVIKDGEEIEAKVINYFELEGKNYLIYSLNNDDILASLVVSENDEVKLVDIDKETLVKIEEIMKKIAMEEDE